MDAQEEQLKTEIAEILKDYEEGLEALLQERDARLRKIKERGGWKQADLARATGYSRETIRQALNPEIRARIKAKRATRQAAGQQEPTQP